MQINIFIDNIHMFYLSFVSILQITSHPALNSRHGCQGWFKPGWKPNLLQDNFVSIHTKFGHRKTRSALILAERKWKYASLGIRFLYIYMKIEYYNIIYLNIYIYSIIYKIYSRTCSAQLFLGSISSVCSTAQLWPHGSRWTDVVIMFAVLVWDSYNCEINMKERDICVETKTIFWGGSVNSRPYDPTECQETWSTKGPADMASGHWLADRGNVPQLLSS